MPDADKLNVVSISNPIEDTPEGMALMDRLRKADEEMEEQLREVGGDRVVEMKREIEEKFERAVLFGEIPVQDDSAWDSEVKLDTE